MKIHLKNVFWRIFHPGSKADGFFRSIYHLFPSSRLNIYRLIIKSKKSYIKWVILQNQNLKNISKDHNKSIRVSFLIQCNNINDQFVITYESLLAQSISQWELIIAISESIQLPEWLINSDSIPNKIIIIRNHQVTINELLSKAIGDYFVCCSPGDQFRSTFIAAFLKYREENPNSVIFYNNCEFVTSPKSKSIPFFKPAKYSPEFLLSNNFLSRSLIKKDIAINHLAEVGNELEFLNQEWALLIRLYDDHHAITHIPYTMVLQKDNLQAHQNQIKNVLKSHFNLSVPSDFEVNLELQQININWHFSKPLVSIIIPTKNNKKFLHRFLDSLFNITNYPLYEVILVDNQSDETETLEFYESLSQNKQIQIIHNPRNFNYSEANNLGAENSNGDLLLFMNNDMEIIESNWLTELAQWALLPEIGVVGAKLLYPNRTIQHAGVVIGMQGIGGHLYHHAPEHYIGLMGSADWYRNVSAVTGACLMIQKSKFEELGCFFEGYRLTFSDVDLCQTSIKAGYRVLYNPNSVVVHHEGKSRGFYTPEEDIALARIRLKNVLDNGDPYFSEKLNLTPIPSPKFKFN